MERGKESALGKIIIERFHCSTRAHLVSFGNCSVFIEYFVIVSVVP